MGRDLGHRIESHLDYQGFDADSKKFSAIFKVPYNLVKYIDDFKTALDNQKQTNSYANLMPPHKSKSSIGGLKPTDNSKGGNPLLVNLFAGFKDTVNKKDAEIVVLVDKATSTYQAVSNMAKNIDSEAKINLYITKGSYEQMNVAEFKDWYVAAAITYVKLDEMNDKKFNPAKFKKTLKASDRDKAALGLYSVGAGIKAEADASHHKDLVKSPPRSSRGLDIKPLNNIALLPLERSPTDQLPALNKSHTDQGDSDELSSNLNERYRADMRENTRLNMKMVIQNIFKNIKNVFTKEESNQPNEALLRTKIIKRVILYLVLAFIAMSSSYFGYLTVTQQYQAHLFKADSLFKITVYHNATLAVLNEYLFRDVIIARPTDAAYTAQAKSTDLADVAGRISMFRSQLNSMDIDTNVRNDLFFTSIGSVQKTFAVRYSSMGVTSHKLASRYTILMLMLEKVLTMDNSAFDKQEALFFVEDNFLSIINRYFMDSFVAIDAENALRVSAGKVRSSDLDCGHRFSGALRPDICLFHGHDLWHQCRDSALHLRSAVGLQLH